MIRKVTGPERLSRAPAKALAPEFSKYQPWSRIERSPVSFGDGVAGTLAPAFRPVFFDVVPLPDVA